MGSAELLNQVAATDSTFTLSGRYWTGKCLICGGPLRFDARTGEGATIEHIQPRSLGGDNRLLNLGIAHRRCNGEKGTHWDSGVRRRKNPQRYQGIIARLQEDRARRWREVYDTSQE